MEDSEDSGAPGTVGSRKLQTLDVFAAAPQLPDDPGSPREAPALVL